MNNNNSLVWVLFPYCYRTSIPRLLTYIIVLTIKLYKNKHFEKEVQAATVCHQYIHINHISKSYAVYMIKMMEIEVQYIRHLALAVRLLEPTKCAIKSKIIG